MLDLMKIMKRINNGFGTKSVNTLSITAGTVQGKAFSSTANANPNRSKIDYDTEKFNQRTVFELFDNGVNYLITVQHAPELFTPSDDLQDPQSVYNEFLGSKKLWHSLLLAKGGNEDIYETIFLTPEDDDIAYIKVLAYDDSQTSITRDKKGLII